MMLHAALARQLAPASSVLAARLAPAAVAGFHRAAVALQESAPEKMAEAAQVVKEVMGEGSEVAPPSPQPLPASTLHFDDPKTAFKVRLHGAMSVGWGWLGMGACV